MSVLKIKKKRRKTKDKERNDVSDIFTSENMENISLESPDVVSYGKPKIRVFYL